MALPNTQTQTEERIDLVKRRVDRQLESRLESLGISETVRRNVRRQVAEILSDPKNNTTERTLANLRMAGVEEADLEEFEKVIDTGIKQVRGDLIEAQKEEGTNEEDEDQEESEEKLGGGGDEKEEEREGKEETAPKKAPRKKPARGQQKTTDATSADADAQTQQINLPPKPEDTELPKQLLDVNRQIEAIDNNMKLAGARSNREMREQILRKRELLTKERQTIEQNLGYLRELNQYNTIRQNFGSYNEAVSRLTSNQTIIEEIRAQKGARAQITPQEIQQRKEEKLAVLRDQARYLEQTEQRLNQMSDRVGPELQKYKPQTIRPQSNSALVERDLIQGGFDSASELSSQNIRKIARERSNPYDVIGINRESATPQNVKAAYSATLARLAKSSDPNAPAAIANLRSTYNYLDSVSNEMTPEQVKALGDQVRLQRAQTRATAARGELKEQRGMWNQKVPATGSGKLNLKDWYKNKKSDYEKRKVEAYRNVYWKAGNNLVLKPGKFVGENIAAPIGRSVATSRPVQWAGQTKLGGFTFSIPRRLKELDQRIGDSIGSRFARKYVPHRKKSKLKTFAAISAGTKLYVGKIFGTINNVRKAAQNFVYTASGLKLANRGVKAVSNALTNTNTRMMGGIVGKGLIGVQRAANGVRALGRATGAGLRYGAVGAGMALALGASAPTILTIAALTGAAGSALKLTTDTLNATKLGPGVIGRFQQAHGVLGKEVRIERGLLAPQALRTRAYTMVRSLNTGFYAFAGGAVLASLLGASPLLAVAAGVSLGGAALTARYAVGRIAVNASAKVAANSTLMALGKLPFMELVGLASAAPWINSQITGLRAGGLDFFKSNYLSPLHIKHWLNYLKVAELGFNIGGTVGAFKAMSAIRGVSLGAVGLGVGIGTGIGIGLAVALGAPIGTFAIAGGMIGGIAGGFVGTALGVGTGFWGTAFFAGAGSAIFSFLGTGIGSWIDKLLGQVDVLKNFISALSLAKTLMDFVNTLGKKFDPSSAFGLAFALLLMGTTLVDLGFDTLPDNQSSRPVQSGTQTSADASRIKGESAEVITLDCEKDADYKLYNPSTSKVTKILVTGNKYEIQTELTIFKNITDPARIEKYSTLNKGQFIGNCKP